MSMEKDPFARLTTRQRQYAELVTSGGSQADAYRAAYSAEGWSTLRIASECGKLNNHPLISRYIQHLRNEAASKFSINRDYMVRWHWLRMTYDPSELTRLVKGACRFCHGDGNGYQWREREYLRALAEAERLNQPLPDIAGGFGYRHTAPPSPSCPECDGVGRTHTWFADTSELSEAAQAAFEGVKETRNGIEVMMADKGKAAEALAKMLGLDAAEVKVLAAFPTAEEIAAMGLDEVTQAYKRLING